VKVALLAGGRGTRLAEETDVRPKPMVEVGGRPLLWHIMKYYESFGLSDFVIALGYKGEYIKRWMVDYSALMSSDLTVDFRDNTIVRHDVAPIRWTTALVDTGLATQTGGRIKRLAPYLGDETFMLTYGDGIADVDVAELLAFHRSHGKLATVCAVRPPARFGHLRIEGDHVREFTEKAQTAEGWINGGFFVLEPEVLEYIDDDATVWEAGPLSCLAQEGQLMAYHHPGFWQCMDTIRDRELLEELWEKGAPWVRWG
jgi:glucose-1-phosphate cytidylyltransferase